MPIEIDKMMVNLLIQIKISLQMALLDEVDSNLRSVGIDWDEAKESIYLFFYFDGELTPENTSSANCVAGEFSGDFQPSVQVIEKCIRLDFPENSPSHKLVAYRRKEPVKNY